MLTWWLGKAGEGSRSGDENTELDLPETPAPVFAARALKSAIFGTPALHGDETMCEVEGQTDNMPLKDLTGAQPRSLSPTKPPGILLTPGTATARRKTVSFGAEVLDKQAKNLEKDFTNFVPRNCPGNFPSPWSAKSDPSGRFSRKTSLTKSLEQARQNKSRPTKVRRISEAQQVVDVGNDADNERHASLNLERGRIKKTQKMNQEFVQELAIQSEPDGDVTVDLNEPRSQSGRFWKSEYESYHEEARNQMQKLVKYKKLAKSFAKMKDSKAVELAEQLKEEQRRVASMEDKISKLSGQIAASGLNGTDDQAPELITELAKRTALAVQYKGEVEEFRAALEGDNAIKQSTALQPELLTAQSTEMKALRDEMSKLRESLLIAERANNEIHEENQNLGKELENVERRYEKHMQKCENCQQSMDDAHQKKEDAYQKLQEDYRKMKESAKSQRRDAEHLLKQRHEQVVGLKKELAAKHGLESTVEGLQQALQNKINEHQRIIADFQRQIAQLKKEDQQNQSSDKEDVKTSKSRRMEETARPRARTNPAMENPVFRESLIPVPSQTTVRLPSTAASATSFSKPTSTSIARRPRSFDTALTEITNDASFESPPQRPPGPVQHTPYAVRTFNNSMESPCIDLPSPEPSILDITGHERRYHPSPRPSMFNIASSPPNPSILRTRQVEAAVRHQEKISSGRLSSMDGSRVRTSLPPDRAAAAKARLEQKMADKNMTHGVGKENVRSRVL